MGSGDRDHGWTRGRRRLVGVLAGLAGLAGLLGTAGTALANTLTVTVPAGSGPGSLPYAVAHAADGDTIDFGLGGSPITVTLPETLQIQTPNLTIIGSSDPLAPPAAPLITLRPGPGMSSGDGIDILGSGDTIRDVSVDGFPGNGIEIDGATRATIDSSTATPSAITGNGGYGILVSAGADGDNRFGGYRVANNGRGPFAVSGPALAATATMDSSGSSATVSVTGASPGEPVALQAGADPGCAGSFIPYAGNTATAMTDAAGDATLTVSVAPPAVAPDGIRVIVSGQNDGTVPVSGCVVAPAGPTAAITAPAAGGVYAVGQIVATRFACRDGAGGAGIQSCTDSLGAAAPGGRLDTARPGAHVYTVTAISSDGRATSTSLRYTVAGAPVIVLSGLRARSYRLGSRLRVRYRCRDGAAGPGLARCKGTVRSGRRLATARAGTFRFTIVAVSRDGQRTTITLRYRVASPAVPGRAARGPVNRRRP